MKPLVTLDELSTLFNKSKVTIWRWWAKEGILPAPIQIKGRTIGWRQEEIENWIANNADTLR